MTQGQWQWGPDWNEAVAELAAADPDDDFPGMKYADLALCCGGEEVIPLRIDHYQTEWNTPRALMPDAERRAFIVRALNCHDDLVAACGAALSRLRFSLSPCQAEKDAPIVEQLTAALAKAKPEGK